jgi:hypothetical protein
MSGRIWARMLSGTSSNSNAAPHRAQDRPVFVGRVALVQPRRQRPEHVPHLPPLRVLQEKDQVAILRSHPDGVAPRVERQARRASHAHQRLMRSSAAHPPRDGALDDARHVDMAHLKPPKRFNRELHDGSV